MGNRRLGAEPKSPYAILTIMSAPLVVGFDGRYLDAQFPGIGRYAFELLQALAATEIEVRALVPSTPSATRFDLRPLLDAGIDLIPCDVRRRSLAEQVYLPAAIRRLSCDVWHAPYYVTAYRAPVPLVVSIHDAIGALDPTFLPTWPKRLGYRLLSAMAVRSARLVVAPSESARRDIIRHFSATGDQVLSVPYGVGASFGPRPPSEVDSVRTRYQLGQRYVLHVGTDKPHKNLGRLLQAWSRIDRDARGTAQLVLAGYRRNRAGSRSGPETVDNHTDVRGIGAVAEADLPGLYAGAELVVLPSLSEGFGLPVLEAMACGTAVACARAGSLPEVAGDAGAYFDPRDIQDIASVVKRLLRDRDLRQALVEAGLGRAKRFSWSRTAGRMVDLYRSVVEHRS